LFVTTVPVVEVCGTSTISRVTTPTENVFGPGYAPEWNGFVQFAPMVAEYVPGVEVPGVVVIDKVVGEVRVVVVGLTVDVPPGTVVVENQASPAHDGSKPTPL
jgi:hypothetical protein